MYSGSANGNRTRKSRFHRILARDHGCGRTAVRADRSWHRAQRRRLPPHRLAANAAPRRAMRPSRAARPGAACELQMPDHVRTAEKVDMPVDVRFERCARTVVLWAQNKARRVVLAAGPIFQFPSATPITVGSAKWSAGPNVVVLLMPGKWVIGALTSQLWSFAGPATRSNVSSFLLQPFINYNLKAGTRSRFRASFAARV